MNPDSIQCDNSLLKIAAFTGGTRALGPGLRAAVWVQGCPFHCKGCIAPDWIPQNRQAIQTTPEQMADFILANNHITGITLSGGEPFMQACALAKTVNLARQKRDLDVICFTGYRYEDLLQKPCSSGAQDLLEEVDLLIDGPYIQERNNGLGLRGSDNQRFIHLSDRFRGIDFPLYHRRVEIDVQPGSYLAVGIPPRNFARIEIAPHQAASIQTLIGG